MFFRFKSIILLVVFASLMSLFCKTSLTAATPAKAEISSDTHLEDNYRALMNLLGYLGRDYPNAVSNKKVINEFEFQEMREFSRQSAVNFESLAEHGEFDNTESIKLMLKSLEDSVNNKASKVEIKRQTETIKNALLDLDLFPNVAQEWPNLIQASKLYALNCASCHGEKGDGLGPAGKSLSPPPSNFLKPNLARNLSPLQCFNTIKMGLPGTAMVSFKQLSDKEIWSLSFYLLSLRYDSSEAINIQANKIPISLKDASLLSEIQLEKKYRNDSSFSIEKVRNYRLFESEPHSMAVANQYLDEVIVAYKEGLNSKASNLALEAYLQGIEPFEKRISASDAHLLGELEASMMAVRTSIKNEVTYEVLRSRVDDAKLLIQKGEELIGSQERGTSFTAFLAASILIREGLEAFLIIIAILGILRSLKAHRASNWVHGGWIAALLVGGMGWFFVDGLKSWDVQNRELVEGLIALFAVIVLLFMGFWLHSKTEITKWKQFVQVKIASLLERNNLFGLSAFAFIVVFREAFESVIFLSSLRIDSGADRSSGIWIGILIAVIVVSLLAWGMMKMFDKIPLRKVFLYSSIMISALAIILTGDGIHALQEGGIISATNAAINVRIPLLGIFPTIECLSAQLFSLLLVSSLWIYNTRSKPVKA